MVLREIIRDTNEIDILMEFGEMVDGGLRMDEPGGGLVVDFGDKTFAVPETMSAERLRKLIRDSVEQKKNLLANECTDELVYEKDVLY